MTEPSGGHSRPRRPVVVPALALVAVTVIGVTALLGGLEDAPKAPPQLTSGAVLDQGRYSTRFVESRVRVEPAESTFAEDKRFLELVFDVTNLGDETTPVGLPPSEPEGAATSSFFAGSLVKIAPAFPEDAGPFVFALSKDQDETRQLHPGVTTKVIVRYELKDTERPPEKVTLDVAAFEYEAGFQDPTEKWSMISQEVGDRLVPEIRAQVTMPVREGAGA